MVVVADTTPIINFYFVGELNLLEKIFQKIVLPNVVLNQCLTTPVEFFSTPPELARLSD